MCHAEHVLPKQLLVSLHVGSDELCTERKSKGYRTVESMEENSRYGIGVGRMCMLIMFL